MQRWCDSFQEHCEVTTKAAAQACCIHRRPTSSRLAIEILRFDLGMLCHTMARAESSCVPQCHIRVKAIGLLKGKPRQISQTMGAAVAPSRLTTVNPGVVCKR